MTKFYLIFFLIPCFAFSAPAGNPSYPSVVEEGFLIPDTKIINFRMGCQTYNSQDLVMKFDDPAKEEGFYLRKVKAFCNSGIFTLNIKERLDLYVELGSYRLEPEFRYKADLYNSQSENNILYRGGTKLILFEISDFTLAADVKYSIFHAPSSYLTRNDTPIHDDIEFDLKEWQIAVGLAQKITVLRPYIGIAYRDTRIEMKNFSFYKDLNFIYKKKAGLFMGCSASLGSFVLLNGEIRLVNERATVVSGELRF